MYALFLVLIAALLATMKARERFGLFLGGQKWISTGENPGAFEVGQFKVAGLCPPDKPDLDSGLCYPACDPGFKGVGPVCWAETKNVGVGIPVGLEPCPDGWNNDGLICREPITNDCSWKWLGVCWGRLRGGRLRGRLDGGGVCAGPGALSDDHPDRIAGLCYRRCPADLPVRVPGMPYLCSKTGKLSHTREAGRIPGSLRFFNTYTYP